MRKRVWSRASLFILVAGIIGILSSFDTPPVTAQTSTTTDLPCYPGVYPIPIPPGYSGYCLPCYPGAYPIPIPPGYGDYCLSCYPGQFPEPIPPGYLGYCNPPCYPYYPGPFGAPPYPYVGYCADACYTGQGNAPDGMRKCKKEDNVPEPCYYPGVEDPPPGYKKCKDIPCWDQPGDVPKGYKRCKDKDGGEYPPPA